MSNDMDVLKEFFGSLEPKNDGKPAKNTEVLEKMLEFAKAYEQHKNSPQKQTKPTPPVKAVKHRTGRFFTIRGTSFTVTYAGVNAVVSLLDPQTKAPRYTITVKKGDEAKVTKILARMETARRAAEALKV